MPVYKDKKNTYYCRFYYTDWKGQKRQKCKRGFKLQREAKEWERLFLEQFAKNPDITFEALYFSLFPPSDSRAVHADFVLERLAKPRTQKGVFVGRFCYPVNFFRAPCIIHTKWIYFK